MKKLQLIFALLFVSGVSVSQVRVSLHEEMTGENCGPCAAFNPAFDALMASSTNSNLIISVKWMTAIPSAPPNAWSLYQTNHEEADWRPDYYQGWWYAPSGLLDGKSPTLYGAASAHVQDMNNTVIATAQSQTTNFSINMNTNWNSNFTNCVVTVTVTSSTNFNSNGQLMFRLCLVERYIEFDSPPGLNGEKTFKNAIRKSYPTTIVNGSVTAMGTPLNNAWTPSQSQTFTVNCAIPSYINDPGQLAFVGFIQSDGDRNVHQAARTAQPLVPNDAKALTATTQSVVCTSNLTPSISVYNNGCNAITALTITPYIDGVASANNLWTGNIPVTGTANLVLAPITVTAGAHTFSYNISGVSGGDVWPNNNQRKVDFLSAASYFSNPLFEGFENSFPPPNWFIINPDNNPQTFSQASAGGFGLSGASVEFPVHYSASGDVDHLLLPPCDITGISNPTISFDVAYCQWASTNQDSLIVSVSTDCGNNWNRIYGNGGPNLATNPPLINWWFWPSATTWTNVIVSLQQFTNTPHLLVRFSVKSDGGNGMFIDNINIKDPITNLQRVQGSLIELDIYPNPASNQLSLHFKSGETQKMKIEVINAIGQLIYSESREFGTGDHVISLKSEDWPEGIYSVNVKSEQFSQTRKVIIK